MAKAMLDRRNFLLAGAAVGTTGTAAFAALHDGELGAPPQTLVGGMPWTEGLADSPPVPESGNNYIFFSAAEATALEAIVDRLIPADPTGPSATEAGVPLFLDRQLAGLYGRGDHFFLGGPWPKGTPEQGYQTRFSPAQFYRAALAEIDRYASSKSSGATFSKLSANDQDDLLKGLEAGKAQLGNGVDGKAFFALLLQNVKEGYFSDPIYGGNKNMASWKMIGFPGAHYDYSEWVSRHGERVPYPPVSFLGRPGWKGGA